MTRVQLALNVSDLDAAVAFYAKLFDTQPVKRRLGYANFVVAQPPLKLVLMEGEARGGTLNHLGVEVGDAEQVQAATARLQAAGLVTDVREAETCCYATQDKVWVSGPDDERWEVYTVLADVPQEQQQDAACCATPA